MKKTEWFPGNIAPVHVGVYEVVRFYLGDRLEMPHHRLMWTGSGWRYAYDFGFASEGDYAQMDPTDKWRGLTEKAE